MHDALPVTLCGAESVGQRRSQVEPEQLREHEPVQVTWHVAPAEHETLPLAATLTVQAEPSQVTLPLGPVVSAQVLPPLQSALHEPAQAPTQSLPLRQLSEQLPPLALQPVLGLPVHVQLEPAEHVQLEPVQLHAGPGHVELSVLLEQPQSHAAARSVQIALTDTLLEFSQPSSLLSSRRVFAPARLIRQNPALLRCREGEVSRIAQHLRPARTFCVQTNAVQRLGPER